MADNNSNRLTIDRLNGGPFFQPDELAGVADRGRRRYRTLFIDFDTRAAVLAAKEHEHWDEQSKAMSRDNKARIIDGLRRTFGEFDIVRKVRDFTDMGTKPFSVVAYHNALFEHVRWAFTAGAASY